MMKWKYKPHPSYHTKIYRQLSTNKNRTERAQELINKSSATQQRKQTIDNNNNKTENTHAENITG